MGKLTIVPGARIMLIRNCKCGGKPELRDGMSNHYKDCYELSIKCRNCGSTLFYPYMDRKKKASCTIGLIKEWNTRER